MGRFIFKLNNNHPWVNGYLLTAGVGAIAQVSDEEERSGNGRDGKGNEQDFESFLKQWNAINSVRGGRFFGKRK